LVYYFSRFLIRLALPIYLRKFCIINKKVIPPPGKPVIIASSHSGSFFDALVIGAVLDQPMHTLTRGDVFKKRSVVKWLRSINLIPVFRASEGLREIKNNDVTFDESFSVLKKGGTILIFSEGISVNEWHLKPLGKGTARMAYQTWFGKEPIKDMVVLPTGVTYEHFRGADKRVKLVFGDPIDPTQLTTPVAEQEKWLREFNHLLYNRMKASLLHIEKEATPAETAQKLQAYLSDCPPAAGSSLLRLVGSIGRGIHQPLYNLFVKKVAKMTRGTVFYDSVLFGILIYAYPVIVLLISLVFGMLFNVWIGLAVFAGLPLLALLGNRYR